MKRFRLEEGKYESFLRRRLKFVKSRRYPYQLRFELESDSCTYIIRTSIHIGWICLVYPQTLHGEQMSEIRDTKEIKKKM